MKKRTKRLVAGWVVAGLCMTALGCGTSETTGGTSGPTYTVGTDASYAPFESMKGDQIEGFDIDVLNATAEAGGFQVTYKNTSWEGIFLALNNGERDLVASAVTITAERQKTFDFSAPYFEATQMIVAKQGAGFRSIQDLKGKKIAVQISTTGDTVVSEAFGKDNANIKRFESMPLALLELKNGNVDAAVGDNGVVLEYVKNNGQGSFETVVDTSFAKESYGFVVKKGNAELLDKINAGLKKIKENGKLAEINKKYGFQN